MDTRIRLTGVLVLGLILVLAGGALAQSGGGYNLTWHTVDGGGGTSTGGGFTLTGTAGQPDAGLLTGGEYRLGGGFWGGGEVALAPGLETYLPLVLRDGP
jgi:hypothetical protein